MLVCMSRTKLAFTGHVHNVEFESYLVVMEHRSINIPSIDCNGKYETYLSEDMYDIYFWARVGSSPSALLAGFL